MRSRAHQQSIEEDHLAPQDKQRSLWKTSVEDHSFNAVPGLSGLSEDPCSAPTQHLSLILTSLCQVGKNDDSVSTGSNLLNQLQSARSSSYLLPLSSNFGSLKARATNKTTIKTGRRQIGVGQ